MQLINTTLLLAVGASLLATVHGAAVRSLVPRGLASVYTSCAVSGTAALTFDDGPYNYIKDISDTLTQNGAVGTFFFNGDNYQCIYSDANIKRLQYVYKAGHQVGSHTWAHKDLTTLSQSDINSEMARVDLALQRILGITPAFMRPPFGAYNNDVRTVASKRGQSLALWDFDSGDSTGSTAKQSRDAYKALAKQHPDSILALNHETEKSTAYDVLPYAISVLKDAGYRLVSLADCLGQDAYQSVQAPQSPTSSWKC